MTVRPRRNHSPAFLSVIACNHRPVIDGKGAWRDTVFVEGLWRSIQYEDVCLRAHASVAPARESLARYLAVYNTTKPHSSLDGQTPDQTYHIKLRPIAVAA